MHFCQLLPGAIRASNSPVEWQGHLNPVLSRTCVARDAAVSTTSCYGGMKAWMCKQNIPFSPREHFASPNLLFYPCDPEHSVHNSKHQTAPLCPCLPFLLCSAMRIHLANQANVCKTTRSLIYIYIYKNLFNFLITTLVLRLIIFNTLTTYVFYT